MIVTIDGPAGTGKSTVARGLAEKLGFSYLDTGAMYRAIGLACLQRSIATEDAEACTALATQVKIRVDGRQVWLDDVEATDAIRTPAATAAASVVAQNAAVRSSLVAHQRAIAADGHYVCEGRDQGTVVFPTAEVKFYVTASPVVRAERRCRELAERGEKVTLGVMLAQQAERDRRDHDRAVAPLRPAADAVQIDTTNLSTEEVIALMEQQVRRSLPR